MHIRPLTSFSLLTVLVLGPAACGDDKDPMVSATNQTSQTGPTGPSTDGTGTDATGTGTATDAMTGTTDEPVTTTTPTMATTIETTIEPVTTTVEPDTTTVEPDTTTTTTTDPDTSGTTADTTTGGDDGFYGPCGAMGECPAGSDCVMITDVEGNFCSPQCGGGVMCPSIEGGAMAQCGLILGMGMNPTHCAAVCNLQMDNCPEGTTCKEIPMQTFGLCTAP